MTDLNADISILVNILVNLFALARASAGSVLS